jgi:hypothetical protein
MEDIEKLIKILQGENALPESYAHDSNNGLIHAVIENSAEKLYSFDSECIYDGDNYAELIRDFDKVTGENRLESIESFFDGEEAGITVSISGKKFAQKWPQDGDWVGDEFHEFLFEIEKEYSGSLLCLPDLDQCFYGVYFKSKEKSSEASECIKNIYYADYFEEEF